MSEIVGTLRIDLDRCEGHGRCYVLSPDLIAPDDLGIGLVTRPEVRAEDVSSAERAVAACPEQAVVFEPNV